MGPGVVVFNIGVSQPHKAVNAGLNQRSPSKTCGRPVKGGLLDEWANTLKVKVGIRKVKTGRPIFIADHRFLFHRPISLEKYHQITDHIYTYSAI